MVRLGRVVLGAVMVGTVLCLSVPCLVVRLDNASLSAGDEVIVVMPGAGQAWTVEALDGNRVRVRDASGLVRTFPIAVVYER